MDEKVELAIVEIAARHHLEVVSIDPKTGDFYVQIKNMVMSPSRKITIAELKAEHLIGIIFAKAAQSIREELDRRAHV
jgi:hypothetical protein